MEEKKRADSFFVPCPTCHGTGSFLSGSGSCPTCDGKADIEVVRAAALTVVERRAKAFRGLLSDLRAVLDEHFGNSERRGEHPSCAIEKGSYIDEEVARALRDRA